MGLGAEGGGRWAVAGLVALGSSRSTNSMAVAGIGHRGYRCSRHVIRGCQRSACRALSQLKNA